MAWERVDVAYVLIYDEEKDQVLTVLNEKYWTLPGGKREYAETLQQAAIREAKEESGYDVEVGGIVHVSEKFFEENNHHALFVTFRGQIVGGSVDTSDSEIQKVEWKSIEEAEELMPWLKIRSLLSNSCEYMLE